MNAQTAFNVYAVKDKEAVENREAVKAILKVGFYM